ncbi:MAG: hypothetical protein A3A82_01665 [Candidatus Pacebacteria bacterium RIFCSPLOWO2_01_FULL_47_12]|nr:MAG: hypothetical protein A3A82_01665 [Candidatus Pacebacteria bacterium RIFCSPLOWO2_01_FULL_47_12]
MKQPKIYTDNPELPDLDQLVRVPDFLPPPEVLAKAQVVERVTIGLSQHVVSFFRKQAKKHKVSYQRMIRELLDTYVGRMEQS